MKLLLLWLGALLALLAASETYGYISGLPLKEHVKTTHTLHLKGGEVRRYVSLEYLARDLNAVEGQIDRVETNDYATGEKIDAKTAVYVLASTLSNPLTRYPKIAFGSEKNADAFIAKHGGDKRSFNFALTVAERDAASDDKAGAPLQEKAYERGQKLYERVCKNAPDPIGFNTIAQLKEALLAGSCSRLGEVRLHDLALFLWDKKRFNQEAGTKSDRLAVPEGAKCPVCGMFVSKYPKWAAKLSFSGGHEHYFDGAKDFFKYYFSPKRYGGTHGQPTELIVTDYYTLKAIDAKKAWYVIGSDVYGPMGHELIPFERKSDAQGFMHDHHGKRLLRFEEITEDAVWALDR